MEKKESLRWPNLIGYGLGEVGFACQYGLSSLYLLFMTSILGMNAGIIGTLMMVSRVLDGISDIVAGAIIDRTHTKWGKARPWVLFSSFPLAICQVLLFFIPAGNGFLQYAYFFILYCLINAVFFTFGGIAKNTLSVLATRNPAKRVSMGMVTSIGSLVGIMGVSMTAMTLVKVFGGGVTGWRTTAIIYSVLLVVLIVICFVSVKELPSEEQKEETHADVKKKKSENKFTLKQTFQTLIHNRFFLLIVGYYILFYVTNGVGSSVGAFYATYVLGNPETYGLLSVVNSMPMIVGAMIAPFLVKKAGIYKTNLIGLLAASVACIPMVIGGMKQVLPLLLVGIILRSILSGPVGTSLNAIIADISTYSLLKDGVHVEATMYSCTSMGNKVGTGIGNAICGWALTFAGFAETAAVQPASANLMITVMYVCVPAAVTVLSVFIMYKMNVAKAIEELKAKV